MHVHNLHYQSSNDAVSDPNVTSLFLTLTEPTTEKANYKLEKSQETLPATTALSLKVFEMVPSLGSQIRWDGVWDGSDGCNVGTVSMEKPGT